MGSLYKFLWSFQVSVGKFLEDQGERVPFICVALRKLQQKAVESFFFFFFFLMEGARDYYAFS